LYLTVIAVIGLALGALLRRIAAGLAVFAAVFLGCRSSRPTFRRASNTIAKKMLTSEKTRRETRPDL
jgi:ABC-type transport system involved in cytochrome c biogenesis permease component